MFHDRAQSREEDTDAGPDASGAAVNFATPAAATARTARHLGLLEELTDIGMAMAREVKRRTLAEDDPAGEELDAAPAQKRPAPRESCRDLSLAFSRAARAVRQSVALEQRLVADHQAREAAVQADAPGIDLDAVRRRLVGRAFETVRERELERAEAVRDVVREAVVGAIKAEAGETPDWGPERGETVRAERLLDDLDERLEDESEDDDFAHYPVSELIARICRDLGLTPDWSLWAREPWAIDEARRRPRSPLAAFVAELVEDGDEQDNHDDDDADDDADEDEDDPPTPLFPDRAELIEAGCQLSDRYMGPVRRRAGKPPP